MLVTATSFSAVLINKLAADELTLPLTDSDNKALLAAVPEGSYTWLTLREPTGVEIVKVENECGTILMTRGEDGTTARTFPKGSCCRFEVVPAIVADMVCNYDCCADNDCQCVAVESAGITLPAATVGVEWHGSAVFTGDTPMTLAVDGAPSWCTIEVGANYVNLSGTPTGAASWAISVAATNCDGAVAVQSGILTVTAA